MKTIWYSSESEGRHPLEVEDGRSLDVPRDWRFLVEECALDFHSNHDGWECRWPRQFKLYGAEDGPAVAVFEVDRESVPQFTAYAPK